MIDYDILREYGTTNDRIRKFFTAEMPSPRRAKQMTPAELKEIERDVKGRQQWEAKISNWMNEHVVFSLRNHKLYSAVDLAWDSMPVNNMVVPLMQYATGRIDIATATKALNAIPNGASYLRKNEKGEVVGVDLPKFTEVNLNLIRSVLTRRVAAQSSKYNSLYPHFKYEPRDRTQIGKLKAEATSERMDIMADQFDYKHFQTQLTRDMFMYGHVSAFPRSSWEQEIQIVRASVAKEFDAGGKIKTKSKVVKEGVCWVNPHPSRTFYDTAYPPATINQDIGCEYVGFWDVCKYGDIASNPLYFNRKNINFSADSSSWYAAYSSYFNQYYDKVTPPSIEPVQNDMSAGNDRKNNVGRYMVGMEGVSTFFTHLCVKVNPRNEGWGKYPHNIWVLLKVAGDSTVIYADILPSSPAAYFGHNQNDNRMVSISLAHELMPLQDQLSNLFSQLLETCKADLFSVAVLNTDVFPDTPEGQKVLKDFKDALTGKNYYASMQVLAASFDKLKSLGINVTADNIFKVVRSSPNTAIGSLFESIAKVVAMADKLQVMSPHEQGQAAPHEISATESNQMAGSTDTIYSFISDSLDEGRSAMKRICFESVQACGSDDVTVSVTKRYPSTLLEKAGFRVIESDEGQGEYGYQVIMGNKAHLNHDYIFTNRDGGSRPSNSAAATVLVQMLQAIGSLQPALQNAIFSAMGKEKLFEVLNGIWRLSDAGVDLNLEVKPGDDDALLLEDDQQVMGMIERLAAAVQQNTQDNQQLRGVIAQIMQSAGAPMQTPG
jgi:hypothetical protein